MTTYTKISRWIKNLEQDIETMQKKRRMAEKRLSQKIDRMAKFACTLPMDSRVALCKRIIRMATILESDTANMHVLAAVEQELDSIAMDHRKNESHMSAKDQMEELTTFDYENPTRREVIPERHFDQVRDLAQRKSNWSDFSEVESFYGDFSDPDHKLDVSRPEYDYSRPHDSDDI
jgi:hypothetical protein